MLPNLLKYLFSTFVTVSVGLQNASVAIYLAKPAFLNGLHGAGTFFAFTEARKIQFFDVTSKDHTVREVRCIIVVSFQVWYVFLNFFHFVTSFQNLV